MRLHRDTLIAGHASGMVTFWDAIQGTLNHTVKELKADILSLTVRKDNVYASGVDTRIIHMKTDGTLISQYRGQSHDIKSITFVGKKLISGGESCDICLYSLKEGAFND